jgi:nicotinate phosphoribosyltransferase
MKDGVRVDDKKDLKQLQKIASENLEKFHKSYKRQINPHIYKVSLSRELRMLKRELVSKERLKIEKE